MARPLRTALVSLALLVAACGSAKPAESTTTSVPAGGTMQISSPAFGHNELMPAAYTCHGDDISPPLAFAGIPAGTQSLALIVDDPDAPDPAAPKVVWEHWVMWNIPAEVSQIDAGTVPDGAIQGTNSWGRTDYGGPCPPIGTHRYFFKLYALDTTLALGTSSIKADIEAAMQGHVLAQAEIIGRYGS